MLKSRSSRSKLVTRTKKNLVCRRDTKKHLFRITKTVRLLGGKHFEINPPLFVDAVLFRDLAPRSAMVALHFTYSLVNRKLWLRAFYLFRSKILFGTFFDTYKIRCGRLGSVLCPVTRAPGCFTSYPSDKLFRAKNEWPIWNVPW